MLETNNTLRSLPVLLLILVAGTLLAETPESPAASEPSGTAATESQSTDDKAADPEESASAKESEDPDERRDARLEARPDRFSWAQVGPERHKWTGEPISLSLRDADLVEVLRSFGKMTDVNLIIDPSVQGKVTVELKNVPWDQALYVILKSNGLGMEISGNVWSMMPAEKLYRDP